MKKILILYSILSFLGSGIVHASSDLPYNHKIKSELSGYEQHNGQHVLIPSWMPPQYDKVSIRFTGKDYLAITYKKGQKADGTFTLQVHNGATIRTAYITENRLDGPFDYIPRDGDVVFLYFYDGDLLYSLSMGSRVMSTTKMKKVVIKIANSMA